MGKEQNCRNPYLPPHDPNFRIILFPERHALTPGRESIDRWRQMAYGKKGTVTAELELTSIKPYLHVGLRLVR
jgi:hypothetical protein